jgi:NitT/TauT family transport system substrate-binding protein
MGGILAPLPIIAKEKGLFESEGISSEISLLGDGKVAMTSFLEGKCDACLIGEFQVVRQSFERNDLAIIATVSSSDNAVKILARRDLGINSPSDLSGKKIGVSKGTISNFSLDQFLKKNGVSKETLNIMDISHPELPDALKRGDVDAFAGSDFAYLRGRQLIGKQGVTFVEPGLTNHAACLTVKKEWLRANPEIAKKVLRALVKAEKELAMHPEELTALLARSLKMPVEELKSIMDDQHNKVSLDQILLLALEDEARWMQENGVVRGKPLPNYLHFIDPSILKTVNPEAIGLR